MNKKKKKQQRKSTGSGTYDIEKAFDIALTLDMVFLIGGEMLIQGDFRERVADELRKMGFKVS